MWAMFGAPPVDPLEFVVVVVGLEGVLFVVDVVVPELLLVVLESEPGNIELDFKKK